MQTTSRLLVLSAPLSLVLAIACTAPVGPTTASTAAADTLDGGPNGIPCCGALATACITSTDCCSGVCTNTGLDTNFCTCAAVNGFCLTNADCCGERECSASADGGIGHCAACGATGAICTTGSDCCSANCAPTAAGGSACK